MGYECRFCGKNVDVASTIELSGGRWRYIIYACPACAAKAAKSTIYRCERCGSVWFGCVGYRDLVERSICEKCKLKGGENEVSTLR
jgi:hypothetical protein